MNAHSEPGRTDPFEDAIDNTLSCLPANLRAAMSNVEIVIEDEPPRGQRLLGLYRGIPLPRRNSAYGGVLPDKISIFRGPITRLAAGDENRLRAEIRHVVLHEIAHHFGISDERLIELDRY
jgi:predicted Zn-dependent protease with MMP-like domain